MTTRSKSLKKAQERYYQNHKAVYNRNSYKSRAKHFILDYADKGELEWLENLIQQRMGEL
ncbi:MAG TPA: hypothetical protein DD724_04190 [Lactobacillus acetotolerans]|nr:hypothetical protein [Lactobacillus acetotolerans]